MPDFRIAVLPGDGIGPDVTAEGLKLLCAVETALPELRFHCEELSVGAGEFLRSGNPLPETTMEHMKEFDAILLGAMGLPGVRWPDGKEMTPQIDIREVLDLYCGLRPIRTYHPADSPLKSGENIDFVIIRENTEGLFFGRHGSADLNADDARDTMRITRHASVRLFHSAFRLARQRRRKVTLVDKANVLPSMAYFRHIFQQVAAEYPDVETEAAYVDAAALFLLRRPRDFDVMVTENMFGDILSDLAAGLVGGMGMAPSGDIGDKHAVFQPSHGTAPDIAGKGIANPVAMILSTAMMLDWLPGAAAKEGGRLLHRAVETVLSDPAARTPDVGGSLKTHEMGDRIAAALLS
ncbi:MAG TPA: isocitrate/isopropylmalate dehydrogenase family protein [Bryobacteraceae bacterium]|nr:isocitrate/isopropylmalate dehydrogenase family protein [Bryobacteraceae bacterium]